MIPIFTKLSCNGGGCHGKSGGQNGFRLSLLGFEPEIDYASLTREERGRNHRGAVALQAPPGVGPQAARPRPGHGRGSAFGAFAGDRQPAQQTFENALGLALWGNSRPLVLEDESILVGKVRKRETRAALEAAARLLAG